MLVHYIMLHTGGANEQGEGPVSPSSMYYPHYIMLHTGGANEQGEGPVSPSSMYYPQEGYTDPDMMSEDQIVPQEPLQPHETQPPEESVVRLLYCV